MKIRIRAILAIVLTNFMIILLSVFAGIGYVREHIEQYIEADMLVVADIADRFISTELDLLRYEAGAAAAALAAAEPADWTDALSEQIRLHPKFIGMSVMNRTSDVPASAGDKPASSDIFGNVSIERAFLGEKAFTSTVPIDGGAAIYLAVPIPGTRERILALTLDGLYFSKLASEYTVWETGHIFIDDSEGYVIANNRPEWVLDRQNFLLRAQSEPQYEEIASVIRKLTSGERGIGYYSMAGISRICAYRPISNSAEGWALGIVAPLSESPVKDVANGFFLIAGICCLLSIAVALAASNFIRRPYEEVTALKEKAEAGLCEQQTMTEEIKQRDHLLQTVNRAIDLLLRSEPEAFADTLRESMGMMARAVHADRIYLHKNHIEDGKSYNTKLYEWSAVDRPIRAGDRGTVFECGEGGFLLKDTLDRKESVHSLVRDLPPICRQCLGVQDTQAVMVIPIFLRNQFWGFVGFDNCRDERLFTENEESIMRSGSLLVASALLRNEYMLGLRDTSIQLEAALSDAESANNAKSNFLAHMSHEIRTPLNAVIGLSELTLGEKGLSAAVEANLEKIYDAGATILSIINDILDIAKIESGKLELHPVRYDTPSLVNDIVALNVVRIGEKPVTFKLFVDENLPSMIYGDDLRVKQIFNNLLSNAFKYTNAGSVEWRLSYESDGADIWLVSDVRDTGIGIKPEDMRKLFSDYNQVDAQANRNVQGTGLGLAISRRLAELMDGGVTLESEYGKGSLFHIRLRQQSVSDTPIGKHVAENLMGLRYTLSKRRTDARPARLDLSYARVLVVDDIATNLDVVKGMLKPYGMKIDCVGSGSQAVDLIRAGSPRYSAVLMDHMMPGMDGIEATRVIRNEIGTAYARHIPIIALTANAIIGNEEMFLREGFQAFISKPINMAKLDAALRRFVRDKAREKEMSRAPATVLETAAGRAGDVRFPPGDPTIPGVDTQRGICKKQGDRICRRF